MDGRCRIADVRSEETYFSSFLPLSVSTMLIFAVRFSRWVDQMGNVHGRYEGLHPREKALLIGSHLVTQPCTWHSLI